MFTGVGCGNGVYLRAMSGRQVRAAGCDLSMGMLRPAAHPALFSADVAALPVRDGAFDAVLADFFEHVMDTLARRALQNMGLHATNGAASNTSMRQASWWRTQ